MSFTFGYSIRTTMITEEITTEQEEQRERALAVLRRLVDDKREYERKAIEDYKNDPELQAFIAKLRHENANRATISEL